MLCGGLRGQGGRILPHPRARAARRAEPSRGRPGPGPADDAAAVETERGEIVAATVDSFRAFADDPYLVGRVAAVNAVSDLWAKGVTPRFALAQVAVPDDEPARAEETLYQVMAGARAALEADGVTLVGGHTTTGPELVVGFAVWGFAASADALIRIGGAAPGRPAHPDQAARDRRHPAGRHAALARGEWVEAAAASMLRSNGAASRAMIALRPSAATDVTGFGLAGHLGEMLRASKGSRGARPHRDPRPARCGGAARPRHPQHRASRERSRAARHARRAGRAAQGRARPALRSPDLGRAAARGVPRSAPRRC